MSTPRSAPPISLVTANFLARTSKYKLTGGWMAGDQSTNQYFAPEGTFDARFRALLQDIRAMGFAAIDLWSAHLNWNWATQHHIELANNALNDYEITVTSLAGNFGSTRHEFESACRLAHHLGTRILGGLTSLVTTDRPFLVETLERYDLVLGYENHVEKNAEQVLEKIGESASGHLGATIDTGTFITERYDPALAIARLAPRIVHIHLRDVTAPGAEESCRLGTGAVPLRACLETLIQIGYQGGLAIEHEPEQYDPADDCIAGLAILKTLLEQMEGPRDEDNSS